MQIMKYLQDSNDHSVMHLQQQHNNLTIATIKFWDLHLWTKWGPFFGQKMLKYMELLK